MTSTLHPVHADPSVPALLSTAGDTMAAIQAEGITELEIRNQQTDMPVYPAPRHQTMPQQERV